MSTSSLTSVSYNALTGADRSLRYLSYLPITARAWEMFSQTKLVCGLIAEVADDTLVSFLETFCEIIPIPRVIGVDPRVQAKFNRLWISQLPRFDSTLLTIVDLDMVPLNDSRNSILRNMSSKQAIMKWGYDHPSYQDLQEIGKWPMDGTTAYGSIFKELINPKDLSLAELVANWKHYQLDDRANPFNKPSKFSDESLLRSITRQTESKIQGLHIARSTLESQPLSGRIDRSDQFPILSQHKLRNSNKFEYHGPVPFPFQSRFAKGLFSKLEISPRFYNKFIYDLTQILAII